MPRTNIDYSNTIIYKLCCKDITITEIYIGHTTDMRKRKYQHESVCNNEKRKSYNLNVYQFIRENYGWDNWDMIEIERYNAIDGYDATKRERYWIEELKASLNMIIPTRTHKEWEEKNKDYLKEYHKIKYENNREILGQKAKEYSIKNREIISEKAKEKIECECGCKIRKRELLKHMKTQKHQDIISSMKHLTSLCEVETTVI